MDVRAILKAEDRHRACTSTLGDLAKCSHYADFKIHWYAFLGSAKNIYTVLEQGAKCSPQSRQWFGRIARERREDDLLQYMYQSRDCEEHGLEPVTDLVLRKTIIGAWRPGASLDVTYSSDGSGQIHAVSNDGKPIYGEFKPPFVQLVPVKNRSVLFPVPTLHNRKDIGRITPYQAAELTTAHLASVIAEAKALL